MIFPSAVPAGEQLSAVLVARYLLKQTYSCRVNSQRPGGSQDVRKEQLPELGERAMRTPSIPADQGEGET